jgi:hypothetical protein
VRAAFAYELITESAMPTPHPLNQAVIAQALHDLRHGQLRRCQAMGFSEKELAALKHPALISVLLNAKVPWCSVTVNRDVLHRLLHQVQDLEKEIDAVDRMLRLGASTEMVAQFHGLTHQEIALRRGMLGLPKRKGRWPILSEAQEAELWERWRPRIDSEAITHTDDAAMLSLAMQLAEELGLPVSVIWGTVRGWVEQGLA